MKFDFSTVNIVANSAIELKAADILSSEINKRTGILPKTGQSRTDCFISLAIKNENDSEDFEIIHNNKEITITAHRLRGLIYGIGLFLRKCEYSEGKIELIKNISRKVTPSAKIRGHQLSYTDMNNTYEAWDYNQFRQYILELALFGMNTVEATTTKDEERTPIMLYDYKEAMDIESAICKELDLDFSVWHALSSKDTDDEAVEKAKKQYKSTPKFDYLFNPGGDPGDLTAEDFAERCLKLKSALSNEFPDLQLWPSLQAPHEYPDWGERIIEYFKKNSPNEIDGLIYGPNHAMSIDEMRRSFELKYPFRFYPDIGHNVRCESPVHFNRDDWHYSLAATLSREAVNPRPTEFRLLHRIMRQYFIGSVTYSEGVNDDVNKFIWSSMDFDYNCSLRESILDYARLFYVGADSEKICDIIFGLEQNWIGDPIENSSIERTYREITEIYNSNPNLSENWRFMLHLFRATCDKLVRDRRIFELNLIDEASTQIYLGSKDEALKILNKDYTDEYKTLRAKLFPMAEKLNRLIGIQLDVEHFGGMKWERGCTLDTIDNPVTDRVWLINRINSGTEPTELINRNKVDNDEYYFSFAEHGFDICGKQNGEFYMNFQGDRNLESNLPMCMTKVYDHFNFKTSVAGLTGGSYELRITYKDRPNEKIEHHKVTINGYVIHDGKQYGGRRDEEFEKKFLADGYICAVYDIDKTMLDNGCAVLEITEPLDGFMISEFRFTKTQ